MNEVATQHDGLIQSLVLHGDLSKLQSAEKVEYYRNMCDRLGLDPLTQPFKLLKLNGKEVLYCDRSGAQQLNKLHNVSHEVRSRELIEAAGVYQVTARASLPDGRFTDSIGAVNVGGLKGDAYANAIMKAETKAKRRSTLDLLGLGILDETEVETIPNAIPENPAEAIIPFGNSKGMKLGELGKPEVLALLGSCEKHHHPFEAAASAYLKTLETSQPVVETSTKHREAILAALPAAKSVATFANQINDWVEAGELTQEHYNELKQAITLRHRELKSKAKEAA